MFPSKIAGQCINPTGDVEIGRSSAPAPWNSHQTTSTLVAPEFRFLLEWYLWEDLVFMKTSLGN